MSAYACEPGAGSEYGVGWMVPTTMARKYPEHQFYVLTRSRCREKIEKVLASDSTLANLHFLFYDIPSWMFYKNEMKSNWGEQINYLLWQLLSRRYVRKMHKTLHFDLFHHLTFNQYRTPSPGFWLDIPFVMGPIGGAECIAPAFWQDLEANTIKKEKIRREGKDLKIFSWFNNRRNNKKVILCSSDENLQRLNHSVTVVILWKCLPSPLMLRILQYYPIRKLPKTPLRWYMQERLGIGKVSRSF